MNAHLLSPLRFFRISVLSILSALPVLAKEEKWVALFNGKDLDGWERHSGTVEYRVEDGAIVGKTVAGSPNSFLYTKKTYGDFALEFEFNVAAEMKSGGIMELKPGAPAAP